MSPTVIMFDLDDTLLDHRASVRAAHRIESLDELPARLTYRGRA